MIKFNKFLGLLTRKRKKYCIIGNYYPQDGLFSMYKHTIAHVIQSLEKGYIPVVDMRSYYNQYFKDGRQYKDNPWRYFFEQPCGIEPSEIKENDEVIIASGGAEKKYQFWNRHLPLSKEDTRAHPYLAEFHKYMKFTPEINHYLQKKYAKTFNGETNVLGIIVRGSDFVETKPKGHAIQPTAEMVIEKINELLPILKFKKIYLATEDKTIYAKIKWVFGDMLIENCQYKYSTVGGKLIYQTKVERKDHFYHLAKEYLLSVYFLSKCKYLIGGRANGAIATLFMTNGFKSYDYVYLWDLGDYA